MVKKASRKVARSLKTGKFVKSSYAKKHAATTEIQRVGSRAKKPLKRLGGTHGADEKP
jgi:hypothetical protein